MSWAAKSAPYVAWVQGFGVIAAWKMEWYAVACFFCFLAGIPLGLLFHEWLLRHHGLLIVSRDAAIAAEESAKSVKGEKDE